MEKHIYVLQACTVHTHTKVDVIHHISHYYNVAVTLLKNIIDYITFFSSDLCCQMTSGVVYRLGSKDLFPRVHFLLWGNQGCCRLVILQHTTEWSFAHQWIDLSTGSQRHQGSDFSAPTATLLPRARGTRPNIHSVIRTRKPQQIVSKEKVHMNTHTHMLWLPLELRSTLSSCNFQVIFDLSSAKVVKQSVYNNGWNKVITYELTAFSKIMNLTYSEWSYCSCLDAQWWLWQL